MLDTSKPLEAPATMVKSYLFEVQIMTGFDRGQCRLVCRISSPPSGAVALYWNLELNVPCSQELIISYVLFCGIANASLVFDVGFQSVGLETK